jgi:hypothetical protein
VAITTVVSLFCKPSENVASSATVSYQTGTTASTGYDKSRLVDRDPSYPAKITPSAGALVIQFDFAAAQTIEVVQVIMANWAGASWFASNAAGWSKTGTFPDEGADGFPAFPYLRSTTNNSSTRWRVGILSCAPSTAIVGEVALWSTARTLPFKFGALEHGLDYPIIEHRTAYGVPRIFEKGVRERPLAGEVNREAQRAVLLGLAQDAQGRVEAWPFILDDTVNDSYWLRFRDTKIVAKLAGGLTPIVVTAEEIGLGQAP